ncbi:hypothetical protein M569_12547 [Genlisea aurea]|uniref:Uncharacterized protein n=1 Tax=Genlisea aurea TaxID=192259 RepID=S8CCS7_9LAMI|nr:hypothetical protein M569_12547 [Genlisea aurea]
MDEAIAGLSSQIETNKEELKLLLLQNTSLHHLLQTKSNHSKIRQMELEKTQVEALRLKALFHPPSTFISSGMAAFGIQTIKPPLLAVDDGVEVVDEYIDFDAVNSQPPNHI